MPSTLSKRRHALVIIHELSDGLGPLVYGLKEQGFVTEYWNPRIEATAPLTVEKLDLIVQLGGVANVGDTEHADWMTREMTFIKAAMQQDKAVFSICLGAQMLADALGARVYKMDHKEVGVYTLSVDDPGGVFAPIADNNGRVYQSHGYAFDLPPGATRMAHSADVPCQAFSFGDKILATQFHPDATLEGFTSWLLEAGNPAGAQIEAIIADASQHALGIQAASAQMFQRWLKKAVT